MSLFRLLIFSPFLLCLFAGTASAAALPKAASQLGRAASVEIEPTDFPAIDSASGSTVAQAVPDPTDLPTDDLLDQLDPFNPGLRPEPIPTPSPLPTQPLPPLPSPDELLPLPSAPAPTPESPDIPQTVRVERIVVEGSTVFSAEELAAVTAPFEGRELSFAELLQARSAVTQLYVDNGYITSGAFIPPQTLENGTVTIQVIEGSVEEINVTGLRRLNTGYIRSRLALAAEQPLNTNELLEGLQLLQLNPLVRSISADLQAGTRPGTSVLQVAVEEADTFNTEFILNNGRSPSVGSFRRGVQLTEANLLGLGDGLTVGYTNTEGSNQFTGGYILPINPRNGTLQFSLGFADSRVIEPPFDVLDIESDSRYFELSLRQPLSQSPTEEFAVGITASRQESKATFTINEPDQPFPSLGADPEGRTRITAVRFFQDWTKRSSQYVLAARSQFSIGLDLFDANVSDTQPDSRFVSWRGQGQWVRLLAPDTLLLVRGDVQLSDSSLVPLEQFGIGGQETLRGYRQDFLLTDNGALFSTEVRIPVLRVPEVEGVLQVAPFFDVGAGWNNDAPDPDPSTLVGVGLGLLWRQSDYLSARLDWGIPLVSVDSRDRTWQESGVYFSIVITPF
ncbi:ShlB/FhaC/HecB family hemolysin secretion/activation protein [Phormidium tenue FACHB-886]|nr:ShlB/FhaC/HecB family hemolysin secretion/activation protein [Phormidium tenue FACHB-886]